MSADLGYVPFDCDNHYYEAEDAFTRHVPPEMHERCVMWVQQGKHKHHLVGGKLAHAVVNPTWDPIAKPGALHEYFRGNSEGRSPMEMLADREPLPREYIDRDARISKMDEQGIQGVWLFPTLGVLYEELIKTDIEAVTTLVRGFNQWILEDWGFDYQDRIFAAPYMALGDLDFAVKELKWALNNGARTIVMRPAAVWTADGFLSPFDEHFDPFWSIVNEAGITTVIHAADSGYSNNGYDDVGFSAGSLRRSGARKYKPSIKAFSIERAAHDWLITFALEKVAERFPNIRIASVENGSEFLEFMFRKLNHQVPKTYGWFQKDPVELFKQHVWINPFWEDDPYEIERIMGADRVIFGSDWPHIEGMPQPLDYLEEISEFDAATTKKIIHDNVLELNELRPV